MESAWTSPGEAASLTNLASSLNQVGSSLLAWDHTTFGSVRKKLIQLRKELEFVRGQSIGAGPSREERRLMKELSELLSREEEMEKQRSRVEWLREGDRNNAFFQAKSREQAKSNHMSALKRNDGIVVTEQEEIEAVGKCFYSELFTQQEFLDVVSILDSVPVKVTDLMNDELTKPFRAEEIERALFMIGGNEAPGLDGLTAGFYQLH